jgi:phage repressor protein C with HTH and peptisase S24 domain
MKKSKSPKASSESSVMSALAERLRKAAENHDVSELAAKVGVTPVTLYRWLKARFDPGVVKLSELAETLDVSLAWLITGQGPKERRRAVLYERLADYVATDYATSQGDPDRPPIAFLESWLFGFLYGMNSDSRTLVSGDMKPPLLFNVPDDSMEPTIKEGALVLVDRSFGVSPARLAQAGAGSVHDGIYLFALNASTKGTQTAPTQLLIRRILFRVDAKMIVRCDNPKYPEESYDMEARKRPRPIGRVVWHANRI